jgi:hypothetical protein
MNDTTHAAREAERAAKAKALIPPAGSEERDFWLEAAVQHGFEETAGVEHLPEYDPPAYFATADEVLALMASARQQGRDDVTTPAQIAAHPAGQSEDDTERCEICDEPLIAGQRVMQDVELGTVHANCCGPEREAYVKDVDTDEPLGPHDPIPQGYVYEPEQGMKERGR